MVVPPTIPGVSGYVDTTVSITSATGASAVAYTTLDGSTAFTFPATVSSPTTFYLPYTGTFTVSALIGSQQVATTAYTAATVSAINSAAAVVVECAAPRDNQEELSSRFTAGFSRTVLPKKQTQTVVTSFASGHGFLDAFPGTSAADTSTYLAGTQSLKLTGANATTGVCEVVEDGYSCPVPAQGVSGHRAVGAQQQLEPLAAQHPLAAGDVFATAADVLIGENGLREGDRVGPCLTRRRALGVLLQAEDASPLGSVIGPHPLEHRGSVVQGMAHDMHLGILPGDQLAVEPDVLGVGGGLGRL
jgi:hypothetical protein